MRKNLSTKRPAKPVKGMPRRRWWLIGTAVLLLGAAAWCLYNYAASTATGEITAPQQTAESEQLPLATKTLRGSHASFEYPGQYTVVKTGEDPNALQQHRLSASPQLGNSKHLIVNIRRLPTGGLAEDSSYKYRQLHPELYRLETTDTNGQEATLAWRRDSTELVVFVPAGNMLMTAAFTTTSPTDQLEEEAARLLKSLRWHD